MKYSITQAIILFIVFVAAVIIHGALFVVPEGKQALVFQFGRIIGEPKVDSGLYFKMPFIQDVQFLEKRILNWDGIPERVPTGDKKYLIVDTTARWRISDALLFRNSLEHEERAQSRIKNLIDSAVRNTISSLNLVEAVRSSNQILDRLNELKQKRQEAEDDGTLDMLEEEVGGEIIPIKIGRQKLSRRIIKQAKPDLAKVGIELIDVQLMRIAYEEVVEAKVFDRMISERQRIAERIRSVGRQEVAKIRGKIQKSVKSIESKSYREVQSIKGEADATAIRIYADAMKKDEDFYEFMRTIEAYDQGIRTDSKLVLSANSKFFSLLSNGE